MRARAYPRATSFVFVVTRPPVSIAKRDRPGELPGAPKPRQVGRFEKTPIRSTG